MSWCVIYRCSDCGVEETGEWRESWEWRGYVAACPTNWTAFAHTDSIYTSLYCPACSKMLEDEGRAYMEAQKRSRGLSGLLRRLLA